MTTSAALAEQTSISPDDELQQVPEVDIVDAKIKELTEQHYNFFNRHKDTSRISHPEAQIAYLSQLSRYERFLLFIQKKRFTRSLADHLKAAGKDTQNATAIVDNLISEGSHLFWDQTYFRDEEAGKLRPLEKKVGETKVIAHFNARRSQETVITRLARINQPEKVIQRMSQLSDWWDWPLLEAIEEDAAVDYLSRIQQVDELVFNTCVQELKTLVPGLQLVVYDRSFSTPISPDLMTLISILERGGLSTDEKKYLSLNLMKKILTGSKDEKPFHLLIAEITPEAIRTLEADVILLKAILAITLAENEYGSYITFSIASIYETAKDNATFREMIIKAQKFGITFQRIPLKFFVTHVESQDEEESQETLLMRIIAQLDETTVNRMKAYFPNESGFDIMSIERRYVVDLVNRTILENAALQQLPPAERFAEIHRMFSHNNFSRSRLEYNLEQAELEFVLGSDIHRAIVAATGNSEGYVYADMVEEIFFWQDTLILKPEGEFNLDIAEEIVTDHWYDYVNSAASPILRNAPVVARVYLDLVVGQPHFAQDNKVSDLNPEEELFILNRLKEKGHQHRIIEIMSKRGLTSLVGEQRAGNFLSTLPKKTDERRNAFTHNPYDRTSELIKLFIREYDNSAGEFSPNLTEGQLAEFDLEADLDILGKYISIFGLSRSTRVFYLFKAIYLFEQDRTTPLPQILIDSQVTTIENLSNQVRELQTLITSEAGITAEKLSSFSPLQMMLLSIATGKTSHRFDYNRPSFEAIVNQFITNSREGIINPLNASYIPIQINVGEVNVDFDSTEIQETFTVLSNEILEAIREGNNYQELQAQIIARIETQIGEIDSLIESKPDKAQFLVKRRNQINEQQAKVAAATSLEDLLILVPTLDLGKANKTFIDYLMRTIILRRTFQIHNSGAYIEDLVRLMSQAEKQISPEAILAALNVISEPVLQHVASDKTDEVLKYWPESHRTAVLGKNNENIRNLFLPLKSELEKAVQQFVITKGESVNRVTAIPNREFIAEMSAYLADVCYSKEYPLLTKWPNVTPYKFVYQEAGSPSGELAGSVLVFEVEDQNNEPCLLVRAFDFPKESTLDVTLLIEDFLDEMAELAKRRGKTKVLVPGNSGAISNYNMTINHITKTYVNDENSTQLKEPFTFNEYDLTNNCFVARKVA